MEVVFHYFLNEIRSLASSIRVFQACQSFGYVLADSLAKQRVDRDVPIVDLFYSVGLRRLLE